MIKLPIDETGQKRKPFAHPDTPKPQVVGKCQKCGGGTRAEEFDSWVDGVHTRKRTYRCVQRGAYCPVVTTVIGQEGKEEETVTKSKLLNFSQTLEWCAQMKADIVAKHLAYRDVSKAAGVSLSALAQGLNMHINMNEATQARIAKAIAEADPVEALNLKAERATRKPKGATKVSFLPQDLESAAENIRKTVADSFTKFLQGPAPELVDTPDGLLVVLSTEEANAEQQAVTLPLEKPLPEVPDRVRILEQRHDAMEALVHLNIAWTQERISSQEARIDRVQDSKEVPPLLSPDALLAELARMTEMQLQALMAAATSRREFFKALEVA